MKKLFLFSFSVYLLLNGSVVFAQGNVMRSVGSAGRVSGKVPSNISRLNNAGQQALRNASRLSAQTAQAAKAAQSAALAGSRVAPSSSRAEALGGASSRWRSTSSKYIASLEQKLQSLQRENNQLKETLKYFSEHPSLIRATFLAVEDPAKDTNSFSGTVFKTVYNGEEEVFGVVAAHTIATFANDLALKRYFTMLFFDGERMIEVPAEIIQLSSPSMLDVALVKFAPEANELFHPLRISEVPVQVGDVLSSQGFAGETDVNIPNRQITDVTPLSVRTTIPYARDDRPGLCGSAVVNENHELVGIHTGSTYSDEGAQFDVGYATNASFLNTLVEAYHNNGKAAFPLIFNKQKIVDLNVDEYISYVSLYDAEGKVLWQKGFEHKFSYSTVQQQIKELAPRSIGLTTRRAVWNPDDTNVLFEDHTAAWDKTKTTYKYDFETGALSVKKRK